MLGLLMLIALVLGYVLVNQLLDRGSGERRRLKPHYDLLLEEMADFERQGGRVQEIDDSTSGARRDMRKVLLAPGLLALALTVGLSWWGLPYWIPAALVSAYVCLAGAAQWLASELLGLVDARAPRSPLTVVAAIGALLLKGGIVFLGLLLARDGVAHVNDGRWLPGLCLDVAAVAALTYCAAPVTLIERYLRKREAVEFATSTQSDAVLYLRSFGDDDFRLYSPYGSLGPRFRFVPGRKRLEELMAACLVETGGLVSVGRPGERLPMLGAARTYWDEDGWRDAIKSTASRTAALLVLAGRTPSLAWEMEQLAGLNLLGKTLIIFPPDDQAGTTERYAFIDQALRFAEQDRLPDTLKVTLTAIAFDETGRPVHYLSGGRDWSSYAATMIHHFMVIDGQIERDAEGSVAEAFTQAEDPFNQVAHLLDQDERAFAEQILADVEPDLSDPTRSVGHAWVRAEMYDDLPGARHILRQLVAQHGKTDLLQRAQAALDSAARGDRPLRDLLRSRYPARFQSTTDRPRRGMVQLSRGPALQLIRLMRAIGAAEEADDHDGALTLGDSLLSFAEETGISTLTAMAHAQVGESRLALGQLTEAAASFEDAARLSGAPRVKLSDYLPKLDPVDVLDDALRGLLRVAEERADLPAQIAALGRLRALHGGFGAAEDTAWTALQLARAHGNSGDHETAREWATRAVNEFRSAGRVGGVGEASYWLAFAESKTQRTEEAVDHLANAVAAARLDGNEHLEFHATFLKGQLEEDPETLGEARVLAERLIQSTAGDRQFRHELSRVLNQLGDGVEHDDPDAAVAHYREALVIRQRISSQWPDDRSAERSVAFTHLRLATTLDRAETVMTGSFTDAQDCLRLFSSLAAAAPEDERAGTDLALALRQIDTERLAYRHTDAEAVALKRNVLEARRLLVRLRPDDQQRILELSTTLNDLAHLVASEDPDTARGHSIEALDLRRALVDRAPDDLSLRRSLAYSYLYVFQAEVANDATRALEHLRKGLELLRDLMERQPDDARALSDLSAGLRLLPEHFPALVETLTPAERRDHLRETVAVDRMRIRLHPESPEVLRNLGIDVVQLGELLAEDEPHAALPLFDEGLGRQREHLAQAPADGPAREDLCVSLVKVGSFLERTDRPAEALAHFEEALGHRRLRLQELPGDVRATRMCRISLHRVAGLVADADPARAIDLYEEAIQGERTLLAAGSHEPPARWRLGSSLLEAGNLLAAFDVPAATARLREALDIFRAISRHQPTDADAARDVIEPAATYAELLTTPTGPSEEARAAWRELVADIEHLSTLDTLDQASQDLRYRARGLLAGA